MARAVAGSDVRRVLDEAEKASITVAAASAPAAALDVPDFCDVYRKQIRPILLVIIKLLKVLKQEWADALAKVVAFVDAICA